MGYGLIDRGEDFIGTRVQLGYVWIDKTAGYGYDGGMKRLYQIVALLGVMVLMCGCGRDEVKWENGYKLGLQAAQEKGTPAMLYFTGEGWCPQCKILDEKVLASEKFEEFMSDNKLVAVKIVCPAKLKEDALGAKELHETLEQYGIASLPTMILVNDAGCPFVIKVGTISDPEAYLKEFREGVEKIARFEGEMTKARKQEGTERAQSLWRALQLVAPRLRPLYYSHTMEEIRRLDPEDKTGMVRTENEMKAVDQQMREIDEAIGQGMKDVPPETALPRLREETLKQLQRDDLVPVVRQTLHHLIAVTYLRENHMAEAAPYIEKAIEAAPDSPAVPELRAMLERVKTGVEKSREAETKTQEKAEQPTQPAS